MRFVDDLKKRLISRIDLEQEFSDEELNEVITELILESQAENPLSLKEKLKLSRELYASVRGLDILQELLEDEKITEIMVNGYRDIFIEKEGKLSRFSGQFSSPDKLMDVIQMIAARSNKRVNQTNPILDTRLPDGSRINVVLLPVALNGPILTIRKFPKKAITMERMLELETITKEAAEFLKRSVISGCNIFISGGTGSGKTTMLNALSGYIPRQERIITIEDSAELKIEQSDNLVRLECRQANVEDENEITIRDLIRTALRMRPDRIVVGEVRGKEALDMLQAMNTGHDGSLSTGHANSPRDMLSRLEVMTLMAGEELPLQAIRSQIASALDIMIHLERMRDGRRKVVNISQIEGVRQGEIQISTLYQYQYLGKESSEGALKRSDIPVRIQKEGVWIDAAET